MKGKSVQMIKKSGNLVESSFSQIFYFHEIQCMLTMNCFEFDFAISIKVKKPNGMTVNNGTGFEKYAPNLKRSINVGGTSLSSRCHFFLANTAFFTFDV